MKTNYDAKQKYFLMTIALIASMIMLGLNACQKKETGTAAPVIGNKTGPATETSPGNPEITQTVKAGMRTVDDAADAAGENSAAAYQEVVQHLDRSVDQGVTTYEAGAQAAQRAMNDWSNETQPQEADVKAALDQSITTKTDG